MEDVKKLSRLYHILFNEYGWENSEIDFLPTHISDIISALNDLEKQ